MRISTSSMMRNYNSRLSKVLNNMNVANQKVITGRKFLSAAESPIEAAKAYQLRRSAQQNYDYMYNLEDTADVFTSVEGNLMNISKMAENAYATSLEAIDGGKSQANRDLYAEQLRGMQKSMVMNLNAKFDDKFLFGGSSTKGLPFELSDDGMKLTFRGLDVSDPANQDKLKELSGEKIFVDLGFGLKEDANGVVESSAFNKSKPGINYIGFGPDPTDNLVLNLGKMAELLETEPLDQEAMKVCTDKLTTQRMDVLKGVTAMGSESQFLKQTKGVLEDNEYNLKNKMANVEAINLEEAIMNFKEADYVYKAALKMGSSILSTSFIDFMR